MLSNQALSSQNLRTAGSSPSQKTGTQKKGSGTKTHSTADIKSPVVPNNLQQRPASKTNNILTVSYSENNPRQLRPELEIPRTSKDVKPLYVSSRDDEDTVSVLSDGEAFILNTQIEYDENKNSGPSCTFASTILQQQQQQQYMGGNYFFRQNTNADENDSHDIVSYNPVDQCEKMDPSSASPLLSSSSSNTNGTREASIDDLRNLVDALKGKNSALSQKCTDLENLVASTRRYHNCYKAKTTMDIGNLRIHMESEREDKKYLLDKCRHLEKELHVLRTDYNSKLGIVSVTQEEL